MSVNKDMPRIVPKDARILSALGRAPAKMDITSRQMDILALVGLNSSIA